MFNVLGNAETVFQSANHDMEVSLLMHSDFSQFVVRIPIGVLHLHMHNIGLLAMSIYEIHGK